MVLTSKGGRSCCSCYANITSLDFSRVLIKCLDFKNAFNSVHRDKMLTAVQILAPFSILHVLHIPCPHHCTCTGMIMLFNQLKDPLGPLLFCLHFHSVCCLLRSELHVFYIDDGALGGSLENIAHDLEVIKEACDVGLKLNAKLPTSLKS